MRAVPSVSAAAVALMLVSGPGNAQDTLVTRCNVETDGAFVPALIFTVGGAKKIVRLGESGLTRRALFDDELALSFVRDQIGSVGGNLMYVDCAAAGGTGSEDGAAAPVVAVLPPPPPPPVDEDGGEDSPPGGGDCGYPD